MGVCGCSMCCCTLVYVLSSIAIILMGKKEVVALRSLFFWSLVIVAWLFLTVPWVFLKFVIVVFSDHIHVLVLNEIAASPQKLLIGNQKRNSKTTPTPFVTYSVIHEY